MPCPSAGQLKLPVPLLTLQCPATHDQRTLCRALQATDDLAVSIQRHMEPRIEKAMMRKTIGRCAGWLLLSILRRRVCAVDLTSMTPFASQECGAAVTASEEPPALLGMLRFYTHAADDLLPAASASHRADAESVVSCKVDAVSSTALDRAMLRHWASLRADEIMKHRWGLARAVGDTIHVTAAPPGGG